MEKDSKKNKGLIIFGTYPLPYGGVSVHIQRLSNNLSKTNINHLIFDFTKSNSNNPIFINFCKSFYISLLYIIIKYFNYIYHVHYSSPSLINLIGLVGYLNNKCVLTIHGMGLINTYHESRIFIKWIYRTALKGYSYIISVNDDITKFLKDIGIPKDRIKLINAYIEPSCDSVELQLPENVDTFINNHFPIISSNAFSIRKYNGVDLYGIDMIIDACRFLIKEYPEIGFIVLCSKKDDILINQYYEALKDIKDNFMLIAENMNYIPILQKSHVCVRPTNTDGFSLSIAEALYFKIPVVASDVVSRPKGTILFKTRDLNAFIESIRYAIININNIVFAEEDLPKSNAEEIINLYRGLLNR